MKVITDMIMNRLAIALIAGLSGFVFSEYPHLGTEFCEPMAEEYLP